MSGTSGSLYGPLFYNISWTIIGLLFILAAVAIVGAIFYITRKKQVKSLSTLRGERPKILDMDALKKIDSLEDM